MGMTREWYFSSESVTEGHPDKVADAISDGVLDAALRIDPNARVACETMVTTRRAIVAGETTVSEALPIDEIAREAIRRIGYSGFDPDFDADTVEVVRLIHEQSPDIAGGVVESLEKRSGSTDPLAWRRTGRGTSSLWAARATTAR